MRVGFVVLVSTILLRRLERMGILRSWLGNVLELVEGNEVDELEVIVGVGVGVCVLVWCKAMNEDNVVGGRSMFGREALITVVIDLSTEGGDAGVSTFCIVW
jgi:hypothetical protein